MSERRTVNGSPGLYTAINAELAPPGSLAQALGVIIKKPGIIQKSRPWRQYSGAMSSGVGAKGISKYGNSIFASMLDGTLWQCPTSLATAAVTLPLPISTGGMVNVDTNDYALIAMEAANNWYALSNVGTLKLDSASGTAYLAGVPRALDIIISEVTGTGLLTVGQSVAYQCLFYRIDANGNKVYGAPSGRALWTATATRDTSLKILLPAELYNLVTAQTQSYRVEVYRSAIAATSVAPDAELQQVADYAISDTDRTNKYLTIVDNCLDGLRGAYLYTNASQQSAIAANYAPPLAQDVALFRQTSFWAATKQKHRSSALMLATPEQWAITGGTGIQANTPAAGQSTYTFAASVDLSGINNTMKLAVTGTAANDGTWAIADYNGGAFVHGVDNAAHQVVVTNAGVNAGAVGSAMSGKIVAANTTYFPIFAAESAANKYFTVPAGASTQAYVVATVQSLVRIINQQLLDDSGFTQAIVAYYAGSVEANFGLIAFEEKALGGLAFTVSATGTGSTTGNGMPYKFSPVITAANPLSSLNDSRLNRLHFSKYGEVEHCPLGNYFDIGDAGHAILRIKALRDCLLVFKTDGLFRLTGDAGQWSVAPYDLTQILIDKALVTVCQNKVVAFTTKGIWLFSASGAQLISGPVQDKLVRFSELILNASVTARNLYFGRMSSSEADGMVYLYLMDRWFTTYGSTATQTVGLAYSLVSGAWTEQYANGISVYLGDGGADQPNFPALQCTQIDGRRYGVLAYPTTVNSPYLWVEDQYNSDPTSQLAGETTPGHKYSLALSALSAGASTVTATFGALAPTPAVGNYILIAAVAGSPGTSGLYRITAVAAPVYTVTLVSGSAMLGVAFGNCRAFYYRNQACLVEWNSYTAGDDAIEKMWGEVSVPLDPISNPSAGSITLGTFTERATTPANMTAVAEASVLNRQGVEGSSQLGRRLSVRLQHSLPLEYLFIRGVSYRFDAIPDGNPAN